MKRKLKSRNVKKTTAVLKWWKTDPIFSEILAADNKVCLFRSKTGILVPANAFRPTRKKYGITTL